jgi:hypothetical protein
MQCHPQVAGWIQSLPSSMAEFVGEKVMLVGESGLERREIWGVLGAPILAGLASPLRVATGGDAS